MVSGEAKADAVAAAVRGRRSRRLAGRGSDRNRADGVACRLRRREQADTLTAMEEKSRSRSPAERLRTLAQAALNADETVDQMDHIPTIWSTIWSA